MGVKWQLEILPLRLFFELATISGNRWSPNDYIFYRLWTLRVDSYLSTLWQSRRRHDDARHLHHRVQTPQAAGSTEEIGRFFGASTNEFFNMPVSSSHLNLWIMLHMWLNVACLFINDLPLLHTITTIFASGYHTTSPSGVSRPGDECVEAYHETTGIEERFLYNGESLCARGLVMVDIGSC